MRRNGWLPLDRSTRDRVLAAWYLTMPAARRTLAVGTPLDAYLCCHGGKRYAVVTAAAYPGIQVLAVYQLDRTGDLAALAEWPPGVANHEDGHV